MATARPLRDVFADVTGDEAARASDPAEFLRSSGHEDLPDTLVAEAVTSYADTAPVEVAEHLSQYVMANSAVPGIGADVDPSSWLEALAGAPELLESTVDPAAAGLDDEPRYEAGEADTGDATLDTDGDDAGFDLDFGLGRAVDTVQDALGEAVDTVADYFGAAPTAGTRESFGGAATPDAGDAAFGAAAGPDPGEGVFGAAGPDTEDGVFGASAELPADEDDADETPDDAGGA